MGSSTYVVVRIGSTVMCSHGRGHFFLLPFELPPLLFIIVDQTWWCDVIRMDLTFSHHPTLYYYKCPSHISSYTIVVLQLLPAAVWEGRKELFIYGLTHLLLFFSPPQGLHSNLPLYCFSHQAENGRSSRELFPL